MGFFGDVDANEIPDDPFFVADGTYLTVLTEVKHVNVADKEYDGLALKFVVTDEDSEFEGNSIQDWKNIYPNLTEDDLNPDIKKDLSRTKQRLVQLGLSMSEIDSDEVMEHLQEKVGDEFLVSVKNNKSQDGEKNYRNVTFVKVPNLGD